jgi:hypothetical protein
VTIAADQTSIAPAILEIAGLPRADWMPAPSVVPWLNTHPGGAAKIEERGLAFHELLETDSVFFPVRSGSAGVTGGVHQYVLDLGSGEAACAILRSRWSGISIAPLKSPGLRGGFAMSSTPAFPICRKGNNSLLLECEVRSHLGDYFYRLLVQ